MKFGFAFRSLEQNRSTKSNRIVRRNRAFLALLSLVSWIILSDDE